MKRMMCAVACVSALVACSKERGSVQEIEQANGSETVFATAKDFLAVGAAKTVITQSGSDAPAFAWKEGDVIGIVPMNNETVQSNYKVPEIGSNPKQATFDGGVWALKEGKGYAAYYPFKKEALVSNESIEFSFLGQKQTANNSLEHLGAYDYMYASAVVPQSGSAQFDFNHKISLVRLQLTVPKADTYTKVVLESSVSWFAGSASLKLSDGTMTATENVKSATINLNDIAISANGVLTVWFAALPTSVLSGQTLSVKLFGSEDTCTGEISGFTALTAGNAYSYAATLVSEGQGVEDVDLGLSVKWASCNLGATKSNQIGAFYMWGEITPKTTSTSPCDKFTWSEYRFYGGEQPHGGFYLTKYCTSTTYGKIVDGKTVLESSDDAARYELGAEWHIPSPAEWDELKRKCTWTKSFQNGILGYMVTSNVSEYKDNSIFLPVTGYHYCGSYYEPKTGYYWTSSLYTSDSAAYAWFIWPDNPNYPDRRLSAPERAEGCVIRAVKKKN